MDVKNIQFTKVELRIVEHLFKHYQEKYNSRQLARALNINHAHASKLCNGLAKKLLLKKEDLGSSSYFSFNYENTLAIKFMEYLLGWEEVEFPKWLSIVVYNLKKFNKHILFGLIFGSALKTSRFNDVDVLLVYKKRKRNEIKQIKEEIRTSRLIEQPVRYVDVTEKDVITNKNDALFYSILSKSRVFYGSERYVEVIQKCHK